MDLDKFDRQLLTLLQTDGRMANQALAEQVGLSAAACWRRVKTLTEYGVLQGTYSLVQPEAVGYQLCVFLMVSLTRHSGQTTQAFEDAVGSYSQVLQFYAVTGDADYMLRVLMPDMATYDRFLTDKIFTLPSVSQVKSNFSLRAIKQTTAVPIND
ncbi:MAG: Lrp/AsnC family transcriptional regulator [Gammaproteobacteria bacterium]|nr:Lrp/AsnC family transcriptional regulator [Gammaproteobacteria bacterium]